ncbi:putative multiple ankyrin repeats single kh domain [Rosellinia necatrix]|uniref:Putative multiple ankyrin repeats single kh domain n=1 Tax=Rosellinia necatrix TaxID=77044 RepID=A0A1W2TR75_ROSNE|nr:putative multiple ankyrin repeats single kh domain [Rosellinia necatrix]
MMDLLREARDGDLETIKFLVENGADVNQQDEHYGNALQAAVRSGDLEIMKFLVENGAEVNQQGGYYNSALLAAVPDGRIENYNDKDWEAFKYLIENGADVNILGASQQTVLHHAIRRSAADIVELLLDKGARLDIGDVVTTPFDLAIRANNEKIVRLLLRKMESPPLLSAKRWRSALCFSDATALRFKFGGYLDVEDLAIRPQSGGHAGYYGRLRVKPTNDRGFGDIAWLHRMCHFGHQIGDERLHVVANGDTFKDTSPQYALKCQWWRQESTNEWQWSLQASSLPSLDLCQRLSAQHLLIAYWFILPCLTATDSNWPKPQIPMPEDYNNIAQFEGFYCLIAVKHVEEHTQGVAIGDLLQPIFSLTTCDDSPVESVREAGDVIIPLLDKLNSTFEGNTIQANRQLSYSRRKVLKEGGGSPQLLQTLLSDATVIEHMTDDHARVLRSLKKLIDDVEHLQEGPWKLSGEYLKGSRSRLEKLEAHREAFRELLERSQGIIQLEFNLASILEARNSTSTNRSMKRLSWTTFVFLPLIFVASLFGMNVDILSDDPSWWWYFPVAGGFILLTFAVWILFKRSHTLEGRLEKSFGWLIGDEAEAEAHVKQPDGLRGEGRQADVDQVAGPKPKIRRRMKRTGTGEA